MYYYGPEIGPFGSFHALCEQAPLPVCYLLYGFERREPLIAIGGKGNCLDLPSITVDTIAALVTLVLLVISKWALKPVGGRREILWFLVLYFLICICDIVTTGRFLLEASYDANQPPPVVQGFTIIQIGLTSAAFWTLLYSGFTVRPLSQPKSRRHPVYFWASGFLFFFIPFYIAGDTGFRWTGHFKSNAKSKQYALYMINLILPLFFVSASFLLWLMHFWKQGIRYLVACFSCYTLGQTLFFISPWISYGTKRRIDGAVFQNMLNLAAVILLWVQFRQIYKRGEPDASEPDPEQWWSSQKPFEASVETSIEARQPMLRVEENSPQMSDDPITVDRPLFYDRFNAFKKNESIKV